MIITEKTRFDIEKEFKLFKKDLIKQITAVFDNDTSSLYFRQYIAIVNSSSDMLTLLYQALSFFDLVEILQIGIDKLTMKKDNVYQMYAWYQHKDFQTDINAIEQSMKSGKNDETKKIMQELSVVKSSMFTINELSLVAETPKGKIAILDLASQIQILKKKQLDTLNAKNIDVKLQKLQMAANVILLHEFIQDNILKLFAPSVMQMLYREQVLPVLNNPFQCFVIDDSYKSMVTQTWLLFCELQIYNLYLVLNFAITKLATYKKEPIIIDNIELSSLKSAPTINQKIKSLYNAIRSVKFKSVISLPVLLWPQNIDKIVIVGGLVASSADQLKMPSEKDFVYHTSAQDCIVYKADKNQLIKLSPNKQASIQECYIGHLLQEADSQQMSTIYNMNKCLANDNGIERIAYATSDINAYAKKSECKFDDPAITKVYVLHYMYGGRNAANLLKEFVKQRNTIKFNLRNFLINIFVPLLFLHNLSIYHLDLSLHDLVSLDGSHFKLIDFKYALYLNTLKDTDSEIHINGPLSKLSSVLNLQQIDFIQNALLNYNNNVNAVDNDNSKDLELATVMLERTDVYTLGNSILKTLKENKFKAITDEENMCVSLLEICTAEKIENRISVRNLLNILCTDIISFISVNRAK